MKLAALALALLAAQETPAVWEKVGEVPGAVIEVSAVRADGDIHTVNVRLTAQRGGRTLVMPVWINCATRMSRPDGDASVYVDGKLTETHTPPPDVMQERRTDGEPIATPVLAWACGA